MGVSTDILDERMRVVARLRSTGIVHAVAGPDLDRLVPSDPGDDVASLLCGSSMVVATLARIGRQDDDACGVHQIVPGLFAVVAARRRGRRLLGYEVGLIVSRDLLDAEHLAGLAQAARWDLELARVRLATLPPVAPEEVGRTARLVGDYLDAVQTVAQERAVAEDIGRQLAESWEEITLLYGVVQHTTTVDRPDLFLEFACRDLLETLPYRWVAVVRSAGRDHGFHVAGHAPTSRSNLRERLEAMLDSGPAGGPIVLHSGSASAEHQWDELGRGIVAVPIVGSGGERVGLLVAGDKAGGDESASSVDLKLMEAVAGVCSAFLANAQLYVELNDMVLGTLEALTASIDAKDPYTSGHSRRVSTLTAALAREMGLPDARIERCRIAGLVHDVGKIGVPEAVLRKNGRLTDEEFAEIRRHPEIGHRILRDIPGFDDVLPGVLHHHERWDGGGYPARLAGEAIPLIARMIALADTFDAMSSTRTYRPKLPRDEVIAEIRANAGRQFDPALVPVFLSMDFGEFDALLAEGRERVGSSEDAA